MKFSPPALAFASQTLNTTSSAQTLTVTNTGTNNLTISSVTIGGTDPGDFAKTNSDSCTGANLSTNGTCTVAVTFTPSAAGSRSASLLFTDSASGSPQTVNLTGTGLNPVPNISSLSPSSATAGAAAQTLTINGTNFVAASTVTYNGVGHTAAFVSSEELTITLSASDQATAGTYAVVVTNPAPGGGASNSVNFAVGNPVPAITSLSPASATAGAAAQTLTINGSGFISSSTVTYNGTGHAATYVNATQLKITLSASDQATAGIYAVVVTNPTPGGGASNSVNFTVNNPVPTVTSLSPSSATAGGAAFTLTVKGTNFVQGSTVQWNGGGRNTTFVSATQLTAAILATDIATAGTAAVTGLNSSPGGGTSGSLTFTINSPTPTITSLSPSSAIAGGPAFTLTVTGTNFVSGSTVESRGSARTTTYLSATQLTAAILASDIAAVGTASVTVVNPAAGGTSNTVTFTISPPSIAISSVNPSSITLNRGGSAQSVTANITRNGYTGSVTLATSTLPFGVTATITQPGAGNSGSISLKAASTAILVSGQTITITASGSGVSSVTATFALTVVSGSSSIAISGVSPGSVSLVEGGSAQSVGVTLSRTNYTGSVTLSTSSLPSGVTATFTQPGTGTSGSIRLSASSSATLVSNQTITITASGSGVSSATATFSLTVTLSGTGSIAISGVSPGSVSLVQGGSAQSVGVTLSRSNYTGSVTLSTSSLPSGVTATITQPGTGTSGSISLSAASSATLVSGQTITITASGSGVSSATATFTLTVTASGSADFSITASPATLTVAWKGSGSSTVTTAATGSFSSAIALSASGLPSGVSVSFTPASIAAPGNGASTMKITVSAGATPGTHTITITGTGGGKTHTTKVALNVDV